LIHLCRTFPAGAAGLGFLLLRVITAVMLGYAGYSVDEKSALTRKPVMILAGLVSRLFPLFGVLMIVGFATVASGIVSCGLLISSIAWLNLGLATCSQ
jgi:hypothetical protein